MLPVIFKIGPIVISTFGIFAALAFFVAAFFFWCKAREEHYEEIAIMDGIMLVATAGLFFSRFFFSLNNHLQAVEILDLVKKPGFSFHGALFGGVISMFLFCFKKKWEFFKIADLSVFAFTAGLILIKLGLFFAYYQPSKQIIPYSLLESIFYIFFYRFLLKLEKNYRTYEWYKNKRGEANPGFLFLIFVFVILLFNIIKSILKQGKNYFFQFSFWLDVGLLIISGLVFYLRTGDNLTLLNNWFIKKEDRLKLRYKVNKEAKNES